MQRCIIKRAMVSSFQASDTSLSLLADTRSRFFIEKIGKILMFVCSHHVQLGIGVKLRGIEESEGNSLWVCHYEQRLQHET